jgi:hypothetical protein
VRSGFKFDQRSRAKEMVGKSLPIFWEPPPLIKGNLLRIIFSQDENHKRGFGR